MEATNSAIEPGAALQTETCYMDEDTEYNLHTEDHCDSDDDKTSKVAENGADKSLYSEATSIVDNETWKCNEKLDTLNSESTPLTNIKLDTLNSESTPLFNIKLDTLNSESNVEEKSTNCDQNEGGQIFDTDFNGTDSGKFNKEINFGNMDTAQTELHKNKDVKTIENVSQILHEHLNNGNTEDTCAILNENETHKMDENIDVKNNDTEESFIIAASSNINVNSKEMVKTEIWSDDEDNPVYQLDNAPEFKNSESNIQDGPLETSDKNSGNETVIKTEVTSDDGNMIHTDNEKAVDDDDEEDDEDDDDSPMYKCGVCNDTFTEELALLQHCNIHTAGNIKPYQCDKCDSSFTRDCDLRQHRIVHITNRPHSCNICGKTFKHSRNLHSHRKLHSGDKPHKCDHCCREFTRSHDLKRHLLTHAGENKPHYQCEGCGREYTDIRSFRRHQKMLSPPFVCKKCGKKFGHACNLEAHHKNHECDTPYECDVCFQVFARAKDLNRHYFIHISNKSTEKIDVFERDTEKSYHNQEQNMQVDGTSYECDVCCQIFARSDDLNNHYLIHMGDKSSLEFNVSVSKTFQGINDKMDTTGDGKQVDYSDVSGMDHLKSTSDSYNPYKMYQTNTGEGELCDSDTRGRVIHTNENLSTTTNTLDTGLAIHEPGKQFTTSYLSDVKQGNHNLSDIRQDMHTVDRPEDGNNITDVGYTSHNGSHNKTEDINSIEYTSNTEIPLSSSISSSTYNPETDDTSSLHTHIKPYIGDHQQSVPGISPTGYSDTANLDHINPLIQAVVKSCYKSDSPEQTDTSKLSEDQNMPATSSDIQMPTTFNVGPKGPFKCEICGRESTTAQNLKTHYRTHTGERPYECNVCGRRFVEGGNLKRHQRVHTGERPFECNYCGKRFSKSCNLQSHHRVHTGERPFECVICQKKFAKTGQLQMHIRTHTGEKPYTCDICGKKFAKSGTLQIHQRIHTGEKPYECDFCGEAFTQSYDLKCHYRKHTGEKPYKCDVCGKDFSTSQNLRIHYRIHSGERPYKCVVCDKGFKTSCNLHRHHKVHTGDKTYECGVCGKKFVESRLLQSHLGEHSRDKPYECGVCGEKFIDLLNLQSHQVLHTGEMTQGNDTKLTGDLPSLQGSTSETQQ